MEHSSKTTGSPIKGSYMIDERPLCQGMRFVLTDAAHPRMVLKHGNQFLVMDQAGSIPACNTLGYGYYRNDTRQLSQWELYVDDTALSLLSSNVEEGYSGSFLYTNPQTCNLPQQKLIIIRDIVLTDKLWEKVSFENYHSQNVQFEFLLKFQSDFADMFEVRGLNRPQRGERMLPLFDNESNSLFLAYRGLDGVLLETVISIKGVQAGSIQDGEIRLQMEVPVRERCSFEITVTTRLGGENQSPAEETREFSEARKLADSRCAAWYQRVSEIETSNELFDLALKRSLRDIYILRQATPKGYAIAAGLPWYSAVFGRDAAITAMQLLPFAPDLARECLEVLAAYQGKRDDPYRAEMPGRIMHELRLGELARTKQIPHTPYYGTVDATQLWLLLLCQYTQWTGDLDFARDTWPAVKQALQWLDLVSTDGYIRYQRVSKEGLENQGWKDSGDAIMHTNGHLASPPIALCEAQAYMYSAWVQLAQLSEKLGNRKMSNHLTHRAEELKSMFIRDFWMEEENFIALALDGEGKQVRVVSSNPGHCLASGILDAEKARAVADRLMRKDLHTGWAIRTLSSSVVAFNPLSYHNGSVWPHDNAIIAEGLRKLGRIGDSHKIMTGLFEVIQTQPYFRLPELFCGFDRTPGSGPINYTVSCSPQAWSAGSIFHLLKTCINFQPDACNKQIRIIEPSLPAWLDSVLIRSLRVGRAELDLKVTSSEGWTSCQVQQKSGDLKVIIES